MKTGEPLIQLGPQCSTITACMFSCFLQEPLGKLHITKDIESSRLYRSRLLSEAATRLVLRCIVSVLS